MIGLLRSGAVEGKAYEQWGEKACVEGRGKLLALRTFTMFTLTCIYDSIIERYVRRLICLSQGNTVSLLEVFTSSA